MGKKMVPGVNIQNWSFCLLLRLENMKRCAEHLEHFHTPLSHLSHVTLFIDSSTDLNHRPDPFTPPLFRELNYATTPVECSLLWVFPPLSDL